MNELTPHHSHRRTSREPIRSSAAEAFGRGWPSRTRVAPIASESFRGLRIVLHECDRRAAVVRCLTSLRVIAQRGAEVVLFDGSGAQASVDGSLLTVAKLFPFVTAVEATGYPKMIDALAAPLAVERAAPEWIFALSADLAVDSFQMQRLLGELLALPEGSLLTPAVLGPDGKSCAARGGAWLARRSDLNQMAPEQLIARPSRSGAVLAPRPFRVG